MNAKQIFIIFTLLICLGAREAWSQQPADSTMIELEQIVVTAKQPATKLVGSTLISTIPGSNLANLGTALDVLAQLPMITVSDNTVSVIGKNDILIYIDGRPMRDEFELQQLRSSNIKTVELLMAPGAEYESTTGAVLKITTRRNFFNGLSLTDRLEAARRRRWSGMNYLGASYRLGKWEMFLDATVNHNNSLAKGETINTLDYNGKPAVVGSSQCNHYPATVGVVKAGFNYSAGNQSFGAYYRFNPEHARLTNTGTEWTDRNLPLLREINKLTRAHSHLVSAYYENRVAEKYLVHIDADFRQSENNNRANTSYSNSSAPDVSSTDKRESTLWAGKIYLRMPLWRGDFTVGSQSSHTHSRLLYRMLNNQVEQYIPSSLTDARQLSAALFASWARNIGKWSLSAGLRYEYVDYAFTVDETRDESVSRTDHLLTPDLSVGYSFSDDAQLSLSYKMTTVRPPYSQLTGSHTYVGLHEIEGGNPALRDEHLHDAQLFGSWNGFMFQADFIRSFDTYAYVKQLYPASNLQLLMHPVNIDISALSAYLVWSKPVHRWMPALTAGAYRQWLTLDHTKHNRPLLSYYFDNTFSLPQGWIITANAAGRSKGDMHTNRFAASWFTLNASISKSFFNKSLTVKLSAIDIFNTSCANWTMNTFGIHVDKRQSYDNRGISLDITYTLRPRKSTFRGTPASQEELNRL